MIIEWIPDRPAVSEDKACTLDVLLRISAPPQTTAPTRSDINLALVIDRSGSMQGEKINLTREAAAQVVRSLNPTDFLSVVLFGDQVEVLIPAIQVTDPPALMERIQKIQAGGSTALQAGWKTGAGQVCLNLNGKRLNRVVLLTDGQANIGETNPDILCDEVHRLSEQGVHTTTLGFGRDYNEVLLRSMAASGDGNHFFVESPKQLAQFFELELDGLTTTLGTRVRLRLQPFTDVQVEPLGEAVADPQGLYALADLTLFSPVEQLFRLTLPAWTQDIPCLTAELTWHSPTTGQPESVSLPLQLPRCSLAERIEMPCHPLVEEHLATAMAARGRQEAMAAYKRGDKTSASRLLDDALANPKLPAKERGPLEELKRTVARDDASASNKISASISHYYSRGSSVMSNIDESMVRVMVEGGQIPLRMGDLFSGAPAELYQPRRWARIEGMLAGLSAGEALAGGTDQSRQLTLATLAKIDLKTRLMIVMLTPMIKAWAESPIDRPSESQRIFADNVAQSVSTYETGCDLPDNGAVCRVAPLLVSRCLNPSPRLWYFLTLAGFVTHRQAISLASSLAFARLLWELMALDTPPAPHFYYKVFLENLLDVEHDMAYAAKTPRFDGWNGRLSQFLEQTIPEARRRGLSVAEAHQEWGSTSYLLESMPTMLYILENHAHQPQEALRQATQGTSDPSGLGALVGAALGALHGPGPKFPLEGELAQALSRLSQP